MRRKPLSHEAIRSLRDPNRRSKKTTGTGIDAETARAALVGLPKETSDGDSLALEHVYLPRSHLKAMDLDTALVKGMRGAGKTFWWKALRRSDVRRIIDDASGRSRLSEDTKVRTGFGSDASPDDYPSIDVLPRLMKRVDPRIVWRTVIARQLACGDHVLRGMVNWSERVDWVENHPEEIDRLFSKSDAENYRKNRYFLVLFDALDRCARDWKDMYRAIRGLLQLALDMRSFRRLRVKIFLRSDQMDEARVADFPDASKILSSSAELNWPRKELYGLLWHLLANGDYGIAFRDFLGGKWRPVDSGGDGVYRIPRGLVNEDLQRERFHRVAGPAMGTNVRRGLPYTWIPNHLGDTEGQVSPRSFIAALRAAADDTGECYPDHKYALHYESIKRGVQTASQTRVREIREDYPWVHRVLEPLRGMTVPCEFAEIDKHWRSKGVLDRLEEESANDEVKLLPRHMKSGGEGVREELEALRIFQRLETDGRVNMPDVFRLGYGLGRKGGVRPVR